MLQSYTYIAVVAAMIVAWRLHSARMLVAAGALGAVQVALLPGLLGNNLVAATLFATLAPLSVALLSAFPERAFTAARVRNLSALVVAPILVGAFLSAGRSGRALQILTYNFVDASASDWSGLSQAALLLAAAALTLTIIMAVRSRRAPEAALAWLTLTLTCALALPAGSTARSIWVLAGAIGLIIALVEIAHTLAFHDELTGLPARRALKHAMAALQAPYAIAVVDVDHFKSFNDEHGHEVGDQVLRMVAAKLRSANGGTAYRSGGEEFTIVFAGMNKRAALENVETVRETIAKADFAVRTLPRPHGKDADAKRGRSKAAEKLQVTISVGVAASSARTETAEAVMREADKAMYRAKNEGRNRVVA